MNYRHLYHAGNFADVLKHVMLMCTIQHLQKKSAPICCFDTHAGCSLYNLLSANAQKTKEAAGGIELIRKDASAAPTLVKQYLNLIDQINLERSTEAFYPGSPLLMSKMLRESDRLIACELQQEEHLLLKKIMHSCKQAEVHHLDGYLGLKAFLPPPEKRGLILIDPSYESNSEIENLSAYLPVALKRFQSGVYMLWYPIKDSQIVSKWQQKLLRNVPQPKLKIEMRILSENPVLLSGCGLLIINPPYQLDITVKQLLPWLWQTLSLKKQGSYNVTSF